MTGWTPRNAAERGEERFEMIAGHKFDEEASHWRWVFLWKYVDSWNQCFCGVLHVFVEGFCCCETRTFCRVFHASIYIYIYIQLMHSIINFKILEVWGPIAPVYFNLPLGWLWRCFSEDRFGKLMKGPIIHVWKWYSILSMHDMFALV